MSKQGSHENRNAQSNTLLYALRDCRDSGRTLEAQLTDTMVENCQALKSQAVYPTGGSFKNSKRLTGVGCVEGSGDISSKRWTHPFPVAFRVPAHPHLQSHQSSERRCSDLSLHRLS